VTLQLPSFLKRASRMSLIGVLALMACGPRPVPLVQTEDRDGLRYRIGEKEPFSGLLLVPRDSATGITVRMPYRSGVREGRAEGVHRNGTRAFAEIWKTGRREGLREEWDSVGHLARTQTFVAGELEGVMRDFSPESTVVMERSMQAGREDGLSASWFADGKKRSEGHFVAGQLQGSLVFWYPDGQLKYEGNFSAGKPDGVVTEYNLDGKPKTRTAWKVGVPDGPFTRWFDNGQVQSEGRYRDGKIVEERMWTRDGKPVKHPTLKKTPGAATPSPHPG
jgi:antitoxin component YwqK of YwqJK toxin-antitoxin module